MLIFFLFCSLFYKASLLSFLFLWFPCVSLGVLLYSYIPLLIPFLPVIHSNKLWKVLKEMGILYHLTCLLRKLYADQKVTVKTLYGTTDWFKIEKGVWQGCLLSPCLFNLYTAEHIRRNAGLVELQVGIKIGGRNINIRYAADTTLMGESE